MSTHPNVILVLALTPHGLARQTRKQILKEAGVENPDSYFKIGDQEYRSHVMESDYDVDWQLSGAEGDILIFRFVTYGYGEKVAWDKLAAERDVLEEWGKGVCERHHCDRTIYVTANYW